MNKTNVKKLITSIIYIVFLLMLLSTTISVFEEGHLLTCHDEHCEYCAVINYSQNIISVLIITTAMCLCIVVIYNIFKIYIKKYFISQTLINSKVQLNE